MLMGIYEMLNRVSLVIAVGAAWPGQVDRRNLRGFLVPLIFAVGMGMSSCAMSRAPVVRVQISIQERNGVVEEVACYVPARELEDLGITDGDVRTIMSEWFAAFRRTIANAIMELFEGESMHDRERANIPKRLEKPAVLLLTGGVDTEVSRTERGVKTIVFREIIKVPGNANSERETWERYPGIP